MRWIAAGLVACSALAVAAELHDIDFSGGSSTVVNATREAYSLPSPAVPTEQMAGFFAGRALFRQVWVVAPALDSDIDGLGPTFNRASCAACHLKNGRGAAPETDEDPLRSMLVRLSIPGAGVHGEPRPHPAYGNQLQDAAVPGVPREGRVEVRWSERAETLADGTRVVLRKPAFSIADPAFGPLGDDIQLSPRVGSPVFGLGLLEAVSESTLNELEARDKPDGVRGRVNRVWDDTQQRAVAGRFGWKANAGTLRQQVASALLGDLGLTSPVLPLQNCPSPQRACAGALGGGDPEVSENQLQALVAYHRALAVPAARIFSDPIAVHGKAVFRRSGCQHCHVSELRTGELPEAPWLGEQTIHPYTDLLVHDMGDELADGRPDYLASGRDWRTAPLWGIGLNAAISDREGYLHDGRARTLLEAILWHGGEATVARDRVRALPASDRDALLRFLQSL